MVFTDFRVKFNPAVDTMQDVSKRIIKSIIYTPMKFKKPRVVGIFGDSGEGKSYTALTIQEILLLFDGLDIKDYVDVMNVYTPLQYPEKIDKLLYDKEYKDINIITVHEAREVIKAKMWQSFLTQAISDINAMSRSVKRLCIIIVSQFIRDITTDVRYTLNIYMKVHRPLGGNRRARVQIYTMWKDDRDLEKPKLRKRKLSGYLVYPDGTHIRYTPDYLELKPPKKEIADIFDKQDTEAKSKIIKNKLHRLMDEMKLELGTENNKLDFLIKWYLDNPEQLSVMGRRYKDKWKTINKFKEIHNLTKEEVKFFEKKIYENFGNKPKEAENIDTDNFEE